MSEQKKTVKLEDTETILIDLDNRDPKKEDDSKKDDYTELIQQENYKRFKTLLEAFKNKNIQQEKTEYIENCRTRSNILVNGGRGSGKTYFLLNIENIIKEKFKDDYHLLCNPIDPTILHDNESFLTIVIAKVLNALERENKVEKLEKNAKKQFYNLLSELCSAIDGFIDTGHKSTSALESIAQDQSSLKLEQNVHLFFQFISQNIFYNKQLILIIDDIDMSFSKGYEILETIRKYFNTPYLVCISSGDKQLYHKVVHKELADKLTLKEQALDVFLAKEYEEDKTKHKRYFADNLTQDYLFKLFDPSSMLTLKTLYEFYAVDKRLYSYLEKFAIKKGNNVSLPLNEALQNFTKNLALAYETVEELMQLPLRPFLSLLDEHFALFSQNMQQSVFQQRSYYQQLASKYNLTTLSGREEFDKGVDLYSEGKYVDAQVLFKEAQEQGYKNLSELYLYLGCIKYMLKEYEEAKKSFNRVLGIKEFSIEAYNNLGLTYQKLEQYEEAIEVYKKVIALDEKYADAYNNLGLTYHDLERYEEAMEVYKKAISLDEKYVNAYNNLGLIYHDLERYEEAMEVYEKAISLDEKYADAYFNLGLIYHDLERHEESIEVYKKAIALDEKDADTYFNLGNAYFNLERYEEAIEVYKKAISLDEKYADVYFNLGNTYRNLERYEEAIEVYKKAIALDEKYAVAYNNLGSAYHRLERYEEAIEVYKKAIAVDEKYAKAYYNLGLTYQKLERYEEAIETYKKVVALDEENVGAYNNLGNAYSNLERYKEAIEVYKKAIALDEKYAKVYNNLGFTYYKLERYEESIEAYKKAISLDEEYADAYFNLGLTCHDLERYKEAIEVYKKAISLDKENAKAYYNLGLTYQKLERYKEAIEVYKKVVALDEENVGAYYNLGNVYSNLERYEESMEVYKKCFELKKDDKVYERWFRDYQESLYKRYVQEAKEYIKRDRPVKVLESYKKAIKIDENRGEAYLALFEFNVFSKNKDFNQEIEREFKKVFEEKTSAYALYEMLKMFLSNDKIKKYKKHAKKLLEKYETTTFTWDFAKLETWVKEQQPERLEALELFKEASK